jgi:hypothetical protein
MSSRSTAYAGALALLLIGGCEQRSERSGDRSERVGQNEQPARERRTEPPAVMPARPNPEQTAPSWEAVVSGWPEKSKSAAQEIAKKYGAPDEFTANKLIWQKRGEWKRTTVAREGVPHAWPAPHVDIVEQYIDYRVPPDMFDDLAKFDGSVIAERTKGEVSARCGGEAANFLALNLVNDIVTGKRTFRDARTYYTSAMKKKEQGETDPYLEKLVFEVPSGGTADPDKSAEPAPGEKSAPKPGTTPTDTGARGTTGQPQPQKQPQESQEREELQRTKPNIPPGAPAIP